MRGLQTPFAAAPSTGASGMTLLSRTVIDTSGSFTKNPLAKLIYVICMAGGGAGAPTSDGTNQYDAAGGRGGNREPRWIDASLVSSPIAVTIGAGGTPGSIIPSVNPSNGGNTSFGTLVVAVGGVANLGRAGPSTSLSNMMNMVLGEDVMSSDFQANNSVSSNPVYGIPVQGGGFYFGTYSQAQNFSPSYGTHVWNGVRGGHGAAYYYNTASTQWNIFAAGRCFPDPLIVGVLSQNGSGVNSGKVAGIGDYPGSGGAGGQVGGFPGGGGGYDAAGAAGRVIIYQYG